MLITSGEGEAFIHSNGDYSNGDRGNGHHESEAEILHAAEIVSLPHAQPLIRPPAIARGEAIGVVAPSYSPRNGPLMRGVKALERAGYEVILDPDIAQLRRFQRQEDERRAANFMGMWLDPRIKAVIGGTGGYGAVRMLPYLEPEIFRNNPKIFVGYSDITALHLWLMRQARLRVFHGPTVDDLIPIARDPTTSSLLTAVTTPRPATRLGRDISRAVRPGRAIGRLTGGNLSMVQQTIGTPYEIDTRGAILFLEETHDPMSVADERLVHLRAAGLLREVKGIVFGQLSLDRSEEDEFENFLLDLLADLDVPILMDFPAGHEVPNLTLPLGTEVELVVDQISGWVSYKEEALSSSAPDPSAELADVVPVTTETVAP
ncbi:MAG TPA: LD-carboxypeptidase [Gemmatimonadaceae bacterium]|jgi:muramoyltetrapeptide carboxypeptidase|nr:LD-carboxypeptidase [Gemmatimonadaceae bacterium]